MKILSLSFKEEKTAQYIVDFYKGKMLKFKRMLEMATELSLRLKVENLEKQLDFVLILMHFQL